MEAACSFETQFSLQYATDLCILEYIKFLGAQTSTTWMIFNFFFVHVLPDVISLQLCIAKVVGVWSNLYTAYHLKIKLYPEQRIK
jgi:hypothetical protein